MGNNPSQTQQQSPHLARLTELFQQLAEGTADKRVIKQGHFEKYFSFQDSNTLGQLIYKYVATSGNRDGRCLDQKEFIKQMESILDSGSSLHGQLEIYFKIFSCSLETISYQELSDMCMICYKMWLYLEDISENTVDDTTESCIYHKIVNSMIKDTSGSLGTKTCICWLTEHMPCLFNAVHSWFVTLALHGEKKLQSCRPVHSIISWPDCPPNLLLNKELFWLLSMVLPDYFVNFKYENLWCINQATAEPCAEDKEWTVLYNSIHDGQSYNRFKHHCFSYNGPTVLLVKVESGPVVAAAIDSNWKESNSYWGNSHCMLLQIEDKLQLLKEGDKMVFLNERTRGLPTGLLLGDNRPIVTISIDLMSAVLHYKHDSTAHSITRLEVWGCAGLPAKEKQKAQQRWERNQAEKLQKVKLPGKWDENPDRAILDMAGVTKDYGHRQ